MRYAYARQLYYSLRTGSPRGAYWTLLGLEGRGLGCRQKFRAFAYHLPSEGKRFECALAAAEAALRRRCLAFAGGRPSRLRPKDPIPRRRRS